jgi:hypothetical protein
VSTLIRIGPALLLALQFPPALATEATVPPANLRNTAFAALNRCSATRKQDACFEAQSALEALIRQEEGPEQRLNQPRCFGALTHAETVLAAFRWRFETDANLKRVIAAAEQHCTAGSATVGQ